MPIDFRKETLISLAEAAKRLGVCRHTAWRWSRGLGVPSAGGLRLETVKVGSLFKTSVEAIQRFIDAQGRHEAKRSAKKKKSAAAGSAR